MNDAERKIGRFMVAAGAVIEHSETGQILIVKRTDNFHKDEWEITYGRIDQFEDIDEGLKREIMEETGITEVEIKKLLRVWHIFRGEELAEKEVFGFTFYCQTLQDQVSLSSEHSEYAWVTPVEALKIIKEPGIKKDVEFFMANKGNSSLALVDKKGETKYLFT